MRRSLFEISLYLTHFQHLVKYCTYLYLCLPGRRRMPAGCLLVAAKPTTTSPMAMQLE